MSSEIDPSVELDPNVPPSGEGCVECLESGGWWFHLRRCAKCGHIGCCDSSPSQHARLHAAETSHRLVQSFEPEEDWFWDYADRVYVNGVPLAPPDSHPESQPTPGPEGRVPPDWEYRLN